MVRIISFLIVFLMTFPAWAEENSAEEAEVKVIENQNDNSNFRNVAVVRALNKSTAKGSIIELPLNQKVKFGSLVLTAHKCWQAPLDQRPESKVLLEVTEEKTVSDKTEIAKIFYGWMFASSPSISSMEHAIYDVNILSCK